MEKKSDLIGLRLLMYVHYDCVAAPCLLEGFSSFLRYFLLRRDESAGGFLK